MPVYSYKCEKCGKVFDKFQKFNEGNGSSKTKCIYCNSDAIKMFSPVGIIFKGSGFYTTDYKPSSVNLNSSTSMAKNIDKNKELKGSENKTPDKKETADKKKTGKKESNTVPPKSTRF
jgi:putative FmdB family regulatory protein